MKIKSIPEEMRPRERCLKYGAETLSLRECLALIIGSGTREKSCLALSEEIINRSHQENPKMKETLFFKSLMENTSLIVQDIKGLGPASRSRLLASFELCKRYRNALNHARELLPLLQNSYHKAINQLDPSYRQSQVEWIGFIPEYEDHLGEFVLVQKGVRTHVNFSPLDLFSKLLILKPYSFCLLHNHPCGSLEASYEDIKLTKKIERLAKQLDIGFEGHWIVTRESSLLIEY